MRYLFFTGPEKHGDIPNKIAEIEYTGDHTRMYECLMRALDHFHDDIVDDTYCLWVDERESHV
jgi:hypothetical protein